MKATTERKQTSITYSDSWMRNHITMSKPCRKCRMAIKVLIGYGHLPSACYSGAQLQCQILRYQRIWRSWSVSETPCAWFSIDDYHQGSADTYRYECRQHLWRDWRNEGVFMHDSLWCRFTRRCISRGFR